MVVIGGARIIKKGEAEKKDRAYDYKPEDDGHRSSGQGYKIVLENIFEGPLDLLIHLIKREKINICDISITKVTDQYLAFLETMRIFDLNIASEFLVIAATLIYIKSRTLLSPKSLEEEEELEEQKRDLVERLLEYQTYKDASTQLAHLAEEQNKIFSRSGDGQAEFSEEELPYLQTEIFDLVMALQNILRKVREEEIFIPIEITGIDIRDKIRQVLVFLRKHQKTYFENILEGNYERENIIVTFLALLELVKTGNIQINQSVPYGQVMVSIISSTMQ